MEFLMRILKRRTAVFLAILVTFLPACASAKDLQDDLGSAVATAAKTLMVTNDIPGLSIGVIADGRASVWNFGLADREKGTPVDDRTLFEIGSVSKVFTATLGAYSREVGKLSFDDKVSDIARLLRSSALDKITMLELGTYTAGGLPLQFPDDVSDEADVVRYFNGWRPSYEPGTHRVYSNPSIGLFGHVVSERWGKPFQKLMEEDLFPALGLKHTYIVVPSSERENYAFGYRGDKPVRVSPGPFDAEAYGVKTSTAEILHFLQASMEPSAIRPELRRAISYTQVGYYKVGDMYQSLGWELYPWPSTIDAILEGNSSDMAMRPQLAQRLDPPRKPGRETLLNKTGSTGGFGAYVALVPERRIGVVVLANRNIPIPARIRAAFAIIEAAEGLSK